MNPTGYYTCSIFLGKDKYFVVNVLILFQRIRRGFENIGKGNIIYT